MKNLRTIAVCVSISLFNLCAAAQNGNLPINEPNYNMPKQFQALPDNIPVSMDDIITLFDSQVGSPVSINLSADYNFQFEGSVVCAVSKYDNAVRSVVIRSSNYPGARLNISRITDVAGNISYTGRILSMQHGDLYELKQVNNHFKLVKKNFYNLINE